MLELQAWANSTSMEVLLRVLFAFYLKSCIVIYGFLLGVYLLASLQGLGALLLTECVFIWQNACIWLWGMEESTQQVLLEGHWGAGDMTGEWILLLQRTWVVFLLCFQNPVRFCTAPAAPHTPCSHTHMCTQLKRKLNEGHCEKTTFMADIMSPIHYNVDPSYPLPTTKIWSLY